MQIHFLAFFNMTKEIVGYKFNNLNSANGFKAQLDLHYLGNAHPSCTTTDFVEVQHNTGSEGDFYYVIDDEQIGIVINPHQKSTFTINTGDI